MITIATMMLALSSQYGPCRTTDGAVIELQSLQIMHDNSRAVLVEDEYQDIKLEGYIVSVKYFQGEFSGKTIHWELSKFVNIDKYEGVKTYHSFLNDKHYIYWIGPYVNAPMRNKYEIPFGLASMTNFGLREFCQGSYLLTSDAL